MKKELIVTAKTVDEAKEKAAAELGVAIENIEFEVLEEGKRGFLGIGATDAKVSATYTLGGADIALAFIEQVVKDMELNLTVAKKEGSNDDILITVDGEGAGLLIGHHGETLDSLQYLANLAANKKIKGEKHDYVKITLDIEGYRAKREEALRALARRMAAKALRNHRSVMLEPMSAYERRIIHSEIQGIEGVSTNSIGSDNNRKIVIFLTDKKPKELFEEDQKKHSTPLREEFAPDEDNLQDNEESTEISACVCEDPACETCRECETDLAVERVVEEAEETAAPAEQTVEENV